MHKRELFIDELQLLAMLHKLRMLMVAALS
jgi:hypothetical protein